MEEPFVRGSRHLGRCSVQFLAIQPWRNGATPLSLAINISCFVFNRVTAHVVKIARPRSSLRAMRVRLKSQLPGVDLGCWYEIPGQASKAFIEDLVKQLSSDLDLAFASSELILELDEYDLLRRSRIEGVLRDGDILVYDLYPRC